MPTIKLTGSNGEEIRFRVEGDGEHQSSGQMAPAEADKPKSALKPAGAGADAEEIERRFSDYFDPIRSLANQLAAKINEVDVKPSEVEVTVGVKVTGEAGVIFVSAGAEAEMTVKLLWKTE